MMEMREDPRHSVTQQNHCPPSGSDWRWLRDHAHFSYADAEREPLQPKVSRTSRRSVTVTLATWAASWPTARSPAPRQCRAGRVAGG